MTKKLFQRIALLTLPAAAVLAFVIGRFVAPVLASLDDGLSGLLTLLGYVLSTLVAVLVWAALLWPLRRKAGFVPFREELKQMEGGLLGAVHRERQALEARAVSDDPKERADYYRSMTLAGFGVSGLGALLSAALLSDGVWMVLPLALVLVGLPLSLYYGVQYLRSSAGSDRQ